KVRSMWTLVMETLTSLKKEKEVVDSVLNVLNGSVDQCVLDGTNFVLHVPRMLAHRVESDIHQLCTGNLYEAGKLNALTVIQLLNEALRALRDEYHQSELKPQLKDIEVMVTVCNTLLQKLKAKSLVIEEQQQVSRSQSSRREEDWQVKWRNFLGLCPFSAVICQDPVSSVQFY
ncbi:HAUS6 protein, partial [Trogon melanurus]|nr:HAUS6 protein [Trogon melanurus]